MGRDEKPEEAGIRRLRADFRRRLRLAIERSGLTQTEIARAAGCVQGSVSAWLNETAETIPETWVMLKLPRVLKVSADWLLFGPDAKQYPVSAARSYLEGGLAAILEAQEHLRALADERRAMLKDGATPPLDTDLDG